MVEQWENQLMGFTITFAMAIASVALTVLGVGA